MRSINIWLLYKTLHRDKFCTYLVFTPLSPITAIYRFDGSFTPTEGLLDLWLHGKSPHTQRYYRREALKFLAIVSKPIESITLAMSKGMQLPLVGVKLAKTLFAATQSMKTLLRKSCRNKIAIVTKTTEKKLVLAVPVKVLFTKELEPQASHSSDFIMESATPKILPIHLSELIMQNNSVDPPILELHKE